MIGMRHMAVAFVENENKWLMMKRHSNKLIAGGLWAPIGGHLYAGEYQNPVDGCIREITDQSGILPHEIENIKLKYIVMRKKDQEIRIQYVYFLKTTQKNVISNEEGFNEWIEGCDLLELQTTFTTHEILRHYLTRSKFEDPIMIGVVDSKPSMRFSPIEDFEHPIFE